ncbi:uncharacterized protein [Choristoneura fumiferana]|uniref:uncharacterized protein n=1 Tax=Choristoneura fumiferana TaxID=7141 RepID=UPI003D154598
MVACGMACVLAWLVLALSSAEPAPEPGRVPRVYNALITSNQNLEPSKAYPVYQPVIHDFGFPYSPVFYGDYPISNGLIPIPAASPKGQQPPPAAPAAAPESPTASSEAPPEENTPEKEESPPPPSEPKPESDVKPSSAPPPPPSTESPIPLNEFGLPPHVLPLGRIDPAYNGFTQVGPFTYSYPFRFYDPYDPFAFNPYASLPPLYRPSLVNALGPQSSVVPVRASAPAPAVSPSRDDVPPAEPNDLNLLNYSSKDPAIPNVPPPPLPAGGLKTDKSE